MELVSILFGVFPLYIRLPKLFQWRVYNLMLLIPSCSFSPSSHPSLCLFSLLWLVPLISSAFSRYSGSGVPPSFSLVGESNKEKEIRWICEINPLQVHSPHQSLLLSISCTDRFLFILLNNSFEVLTIWSSVCESQVLHACCKDTGGLPRTSRML